MGEAHDRRLQLMLAFGVVFLATLACVCFVLYGYLNIYITDTTEGGIRYTVAMILGPVLCVVGWVAGVLLNRLVMEIKRPTQDKNLRRMSSLEQKLASEDKEATTMNATIGEAEAPLCSDDTVGTLYRAMKLKVTVESRLALLEERLPEIEDITTADANMILALFPADDAPRAFDLMEPHLTDERVSCGVSATPLRVSWTTEGRFSSVLS